MPYFFSSTTQHLNNGKTLGTKKNILLGKKSEGIPFTANSVHDHSELENSSEVNTSARVMVTSKSRSGETDYLLKAC